MNKVSKTGFTFRKFFLVKDTVKLKIWIYQIINLPVALCESETWFLTLGEVYKLKVLENRELRRIFGPKTDEVTGGWRKQYNEELRDLYSSASIVRIIKARRMRWAGHVVRMGGEEDRL
jgi:hypothetical protein